MKSRLFMLMFYIGFIFPVHAEGQAIKLPMDDRQRLIIENTKLSGIAFMEAYMSSDVEQRRLAEMYLIGVMDSTEGEEWCGYSIALPGSLQEQIYIALEKLSPDSLEDRASDLVASILADKLPC